MDGQKRNFAYLPHLDGLRAISVFAILTFHLRSDWLPGGFLGVDIFFIISGFLITGLLLDEVQNYGRIDFSRFYLRRFKRLFPAFILVILLTLISAYALFDQLKFISVSKTAMVSVFGISNLYFYKTANYFDLSSIEKPLLHIWSLNVEEQFYFIWPVILFATYRIILKRSKYFFILLSVLFLISIYFNLNHPVVTFYLPFFRFYEFLIGASIALFPWRNGSFRRHSSTLFIASIVVLSLTFLTFDSTSLLPGPSSLLFIIPTVYLIIQGRVKSRLNFLDINIFRYIGKRSYTIYLVHWPVIVFYLESKSVQKLSAFEALFLTLIILIISDILYRFYEIPMRISRNNSKRFWISMFTLLLLVITICIPTLILEKKPLNNQKGLLYTQSEIDAGKQLRFSTRIKICEIKGWEKCDIPQSDKFNVLIMGDSHAVDALNAMYALFPEFDYSMSQLGGCPPTNRLTELVSRTFPDLESCVDLNSQRFNLKYLEKFDLVVVNVLFGWYPPSELIYYLRYLDSVGVDKVIVFGEYLEMKEDLPLLINSSGFNILRTKKFILPLKDSDESVMKISKGLDFFYVDKFQNLAGRVENSFWNKGLPFTWDTHHLSYDYSSKLLERDFDKLAQYINGQ